MSPRPFSAAVPPRPWLCVCAPGAGCEEALAALRCEFALAGWTVVEGVGTRADGRRTAHVAGAVGRTDIEAVADLLTHSNPAVVACVDLATSVELHDQCRRVARAEWYDEEHRPVSFGLDPCQTGLLACLADGLDVAEAARRANLSGRTAARRLVAARSTLGARTNAEAAVRIGARLEQLRS